MHPNHKPEAPECANVTFREYQPSEAEVARCSLEIGDPKDLPVQPDVPSVSDPDAWSVMEIGPDRRCRGINPTDRILIGTMVCYAERCGAMLLAQIIDRLKGHYAVWAGFTSAAQKDHFMHLAARGNFACILAEPDLQRIADLKPVPEVFTKAELDSIRFTADNTHRSISEQEEELHKRIMKILEDD